MRALLKFGVNPLLADSTGRKAIDYAFRGGLSGAVDTLLPYSKNFKPRSDDIAYFLQACYRLGTNENPNWLQEWKSGKSCEEGHSYLEKVKQYYQSKNWLNI